MKYLDGLSVLALEWIKALNLTHRMTDDATASEREIIRRRAQNAADKVDKMYSELAASGQLKDLHQRYKTARLSGKKIPPWNVYLLSEKRRMVRAMAIEQRKKAMKGIVS